MAYSRPAGLLAGFHAHQPDAGVPELQYAGEQWAPCNFFIPLHQHEIWEFYLQVSGESSWECEGAIHTLCAGTFLAVPPHRNHQMHERPEAKHHFFFAGIDLPAVLARMPELAPSWQPGRVVCTQSAEPLQTLFRQLVREISLDLPHRALGLRAAVDWLVIEASRLVQAGDSPDAARPDPLVCHPAVHLAKELLERSPSEPWHLADLGDRTGLSPTHLAERFTKDVGMAPHQYLLQWRIKQAQEMLRTSELAVTEIAHELGFSSSQHFAAVFKKQTGLTASQYRRGAAPSGPTGGE